MIWQVSIEDEFFDNFPKLDELVLHKLNLMLRDVDWLRTTNLLSLTKAAGNREALWESILMVWQLKSLERDLEGSNSDFLRLWAEHLSAWLVSGSIGILDRMIVNHWDIVSSQ